MPLLQFHLSLACIKAFNSWQEQQSAPKKQKFMPHQMSVVTFHLVVAKVSREIVTEISQGSFIWKERKKERKKGKTKRTNELEIACTNGWLKNRKERQKEGKSKKERMNELINASKKNVVLIILK